MAGGAAFAPAHCRVGSNGAGSRRLLPVRAGRIAVVRHGVDVEFFRIGLRRAGKGQSGVLLAVSTTHPHKNFERLLEGFVRFRQTHPEHRLVIAGLEGRSAAGLEKARRRLGLEDAVSLTGGYHARKSIGCSSPRTRMIAPSLFEGFGMPVLEALAAGIPTAVAAIPVFDEVAGDAALRFDPLSIDALAEALARLTDDEGFRSAARHTGPEQARLVRLGDIGGSYIGHIERLLSAVTLRLSGQCVGGTEPGLRAASGAMASFSA